MQQHRNRDCNLMQPLSIEIETAADERICLHSPLKHHIIKNKFVDTYNGWVNTRIATLMRYYKRYCQYWSYLAPELEQQWTKFMINHVGYGKLIILGKLEDVGFDCNDIGTFSKHDHNHLEENLFNFIQIIENAIYAKGIAGNEQKMFKCTSCSDIIYLPKIDSRVKYRCRCELINPKISVKYCSRLCQKMHWNKQHRYECAQNRKILNTVQQFIDFSIKYLK